LQENLARLVPYLKGNKVAAALQSINSLISEILNLNFFVGEVALSRSMHSVHIGMLGGNFISLMLPDSLG